MLFRQFFTRSCSAYSYLLADSVTGQGLIIDPVLESIDEYLRFISESKIQLRLALDTHLHADHITALGALREHTGCRTMMGVQSPVDCVTAKFSDGDVIRLDDLALQMIYTPGHTDDSYSFYLTQPNQSYLFTGDTLLIRGTGRTDFQNGDAGQQYHSIFQRLMCFDGDTLVYPGHDYKGWNVTSIAEERACNPRLQVDNQQQYISLMSALQLPLPEKIQLALPANRACGQINL